MTDAEIAYYVGSLIVCYLAGLKIGKAVRLIKDLGNGA